MPKTTAQRLREYRARIKLDSTLHAIAKEKERERWKIRAVKMKKAVRTLQEENERKEKERNRKAKWRASKKCSNFTPENPSTSYKNSSGLCKKFYKADKNLCTESLKKASVLAKIVQNLTLRRQIELFSQYSNRKQSLPPGMKALV